jgi:hypothetical protein
VLFGLAVLNGDCGVYAIGQNFGNGVGCIVIDPRAVLGPMAPGNGGGDRLSPHLIRPAAVTLLAFAFDQWLWH